MRIFDAQIRSDSRTDDELKNLAYFGTEHALTTAHPRRAFENAADLLAYFAELVGDELDRLARCGIAARTALGLLPASVPRRAHPELWPALEQLLIDPRVAAVGEIGVWDDAKPQWALFERQARLALEARLPVVVTPPAELRVNMTYKMMDRLGQLGLPPHRCMMNLLDARVLPTVLEEGYTGGIAVGYGRTDPRAAARLLRATLERAPEALDQIVLCTSLRAGSADILGIPKTLVALAETGLDSTAVSALAYGNAERLFRSARTES